jgi:DNA mismatch endonuclease, patch repair protein
MDTISVARRSALMSRIRAEDTKPELVVRRMLHRLGYRYVLHDVRLPGKPDLVFPARGAVVLVHGCFWHGHGCALASNPKSNKDYWVGKLARNTARDARNMRKLRSLHWRVAIVWECATQRKDLTGLERRLVRFLDRGNKA